MRPLKAEKEYERGPIVCYANSGQPGSTVDRQEEAARRPEGGRADDSDDVHFFSAYRYRTRGRPDDLKWVEWMEVWTEAIGRD